MQLLSFLTRRQAWLSPYDIGREFRPDGTKTTARTIHRWFHFLREHGGFVYYPYPRANLLGLQDVLVRIHDLRNPSILGILPFAASFNVEVGLGTGEPFVSQGYWVPGPALDAFRDYWRAARDLGFAGDVEILPCRNTHFIFSPFHELVGEDGVARFEKVADNAYFEGLLRRNIKGRFEVRIGEPIAKSPLVVPVVVEHIWVHFSSRQVWQAIRSAGEERIRQYMKGHLARALDRPGAALRLVQRQWTELMRNFDGVFLQPRVFFDWIGLRNTSWVSILMKPGSVDKMVEAASRISQRSILVHLKPGMEFEERCHILSFLPSDQLLPILQIVRNYHRDREPPVIAMQDRERTIALFQPTFCKLDWRLFDPTSLAWRFDADGYLERLKAAPA